MSYTKNYYAPAQGHNAMMLSDVCRVRPVGGRRVRLTGWMARFG